MSSPPTLSLQLLPRPHTKSTSRGKKIKRNAQVPTSQGQKMKRNAQVPTSQGQKTQCASPY